MANEQSITYERAQAAQEKAVRRRERRLRAAHARQYGADDAETRRSPTQKAGWLAEERAKTWLESAGLIVLARNLRARTGEIDLVCLDGSVLVFVEVRHRRSNRYGGAAASVNPGKQRRLAKTAALLLPALARHCTQGRLPACRFDVVALDGDDHLNWIKNAFSLA